ncbi:threonine aldolase [Amycolatopsis orientalis]|uniref:Threonine aldolase n=1 Tax=Amycolatopsis orientalis TaxID=31958 RepID=A0A193BUH5_AMYOR|nr:GntG family PLP-dependent aldolase [Amycolatopsis orientalis]ANN15824.1 threonine aldolase [Amycolatopsis orientalis]
MAEPGEGAIDLRSDTVTRPDRAMRAAMERAEVADNVIDTDPTMAVLERRIAVLLGMPAGLWMPSGTMANLVALMVHLQRGDRFLAPRDVHILADELGGAAWLAGGMPEPMPHDGGPGRPSPSAVRSACPPTGTAYNELRTTLLCLENTHNAAGGAVTSPDEHERLVMAARDRGLLVHLDGARLWNAAVALGVAPSALTTGVDSVQVCLSKGLGAPVGSVLAGNEEFIAAGRRVRQMLGGGVRQGGVLAAAGLVALDRIDELVEDHGKARTLASGLARLGWAVNRPETNIVLATVPSVPVMLTKLARLGILASEIAGQVRFVTHRDITHSGIEDVLVRISAGIAVAEPVEEIGFALEG